MEVRKLICMRSSIKNIENVKKILNKTYKKKCKHGMIQITFTHLVYFQQTATQLVANCLCIFRVNRTFIKNSFNGHDYLSIIVN